MNAGEREEVNPQPLLKKPLSTEGCPFMSDHLSAAHNGKLALEATTAHEPVDKKQETLNFCPAN